MLVGHCAELELNCPALGKESDADEFVGGNALLGWFIHTILLSCHII
jgi:hypothetical protein